MYDTLIIDLDGPLFDARSAMLKAMESTIDRFAQQYGRPACHLASLPLLRPTSLIALVYAEANLSAEDLHLVCDAYRGALERNEAAVDVAQDVRAWIATMSQHRWTLAILTSRREEEARALLNAKGLGGVFKAIVGRDSGPPPKPAGDGITSILNQVGRVATTAVMLGDSDSDFEAASAAGVAYVHAGWSTEPSTVDLRFPSLLARRPGDICDALLDPSPSDLAPGGLPPELVDAIRQGDLAFFAGAGASIPSGLGAWKQQYEPLLARAGVAWMSGARDLPDVVQLACSASDGGTKAFEEFKKSFRGNQRPNHYHFAMLRTRARRIWTSNYDQLFERAIDIGNLDHRVVKDDRELLNNYASGPLVVKVNGDFENATFDHNLEWGVVLTRQQFDRALRERPEIWRLFEDDFRNRSLVFVGVSFEDPILRQMISIATDRIPKSHYTHLLLAKVPNHPLERTLQAREARNLERFHVRTLWFSKYDEIRDFVSRIAVAAARPVIGVAGNTRTDVGTSPNTAELEAQRDAVILPDGSLTAAQLREVNLALGRTLAREGYRITSGGAPYVGTPAVEAAFDVDAACARFYFRKGGGRSYTRMAPAIVIASDNYDNMRQHFIAEVSMLVAIGGYRIGSDKGVAQEIDLATARGVPVLLFPQAGGDVAQLRASFMERIDAFYGGSELAKAVRTSNEECAAVAPDALQGYMRDRMPALVETILRALMESATDAPATRSGAVGDGSW